MSKKLVGTFQGALFRSAVGGLGLPTPVWLGIPLQEVGREECFVGESQLILSCCLIRVLEGWHDLPGITFLGHRLMIPLNERRG